MTRSREIPEDFRSDGQKERDSVRQYTGEGVIRKIWLTPYFKDNGKHQGGGLSILFDTEENCKQVFHEVTATPNGRQSYPYHIGRSAFGGVRSGHIQAEEALCISPSNGRLLHIESIGVSTLAKLNGVLESLFAEGLPKSIMEKGKSR